MKFAHCLMHVPYEGPGMISDWLHAHDISLRKWQLYEKPDLPEAEAVDLLVIMGGPMSVNDRDGFPGLDEEMDLINACMQAGKKLVGICLGAQLLAVSLGARVYRNRDPEIGWFPVRVDPAFRKIHPVLPAFFVPFHWHGESFEMPSDSIPLGSSDATVCQGFLHESNILGLQFHLETGTASFEEMLPHIEDNLEGMFLQDHAELREGLKYIDTNQLLLDALLEEFLFNKSST